MCQKLGIKICLFFIPTAQHGTALVYLEVLPAEPPTILKNVGFIGGLLTPVPTLLGFWDLVSMLLVYFQKLEGPSNWESYTIRKNNYCILKCIVGQHLRK